MSDLGGNGCQGDVVLCVVSCVVVLVIVLCLCLVCSVFWCVWLMLMLKKLGWCVLFCEVANGWWMSDLGGNVFF